ncbi:MAG: SUMF1/EgtB/PvdO family nonheme iron enzyme [Planctomycetota bacterium]|nr:SUMF1/EgtB/PvdO family nonheme iron enzyme [Planctomycetota bacterium]
MGDLGNVGELSGGGTYGPRICGSVAYDYRIGKYEVTAGQYTGFLNKVGGVDTYGLYKSDMSGCGITQSGGGTLANPYTYAVAPDFVNRPVNLASWGDAARFANWLNNGQPSGAQGLATTEDGTYYLNGAMTSNALMAVSRKPGSTWAITSEDEWYKAAYYKGGGTNAGYWDFPTRSNTAPGRDMTDASGNNANYYTGSGAYPIDSGNYTTVVGEFQNSPSPYGTYDQGGNVYEWTESIIGNDRGLRGGMYDSTAIYLQASDRNFNGPIHDSYGFRVVQVPEPATLSLLALGGLLALRRHR